MTEGGFGLAKAKREGLCISYIDAVEWCGHTDQMEAQFSKRYAKWYYWPVRKLIRKAFVTAWHAALKEEARRVG
jgi:hypothetical protein